MGRIKNTGNNIKKTLELSDLKEELGCDPVGTKIKGDFAVRQIDSMPVSQHASKKKVTFYLDKDSEAKLNEVFSRKLMSNEKVDKSALINRAIELLWKEEKEYLI